jgi:hypothetical protein
MKTKILSSIVRALKQKTLPILDYLLIDKTHLTSTDLQVYVKVRHTLPVLSDLILVNAAQFIRKLADVSAPFKIEQELNGVRITTPTSVAVLQSSDGDFPSFPVTDSKELMGVLTEGDINIMSRSLGFVADDDLRPVMESVFVDKGHIVASDAHVIIFTKTPGRDFQLAVPKKVVGLMSLLPGVYEIYKGTRHLFAESSDATICWRDEGLNYPNWQKVVPEQTGSVIIPIAETIAALKRVSSTMNSYTHLVVWRINGEELLIKTKDNDFLITSTEKVPIVNTGCYEIETGFKHGLLLRILREIQADGMFQAEFKFTDSVRAFTFADKFLLMPMMLSEPFE